MKLYRKLSYVGLLGLTLLLSACVGIPDGITPVAGFQVERYLGKWYEVARLDHSFERGLEQVTAEYSTREDGDIRVINRGYNTSKQKWEEAEGRAKFVGSKDVGQLKVSFFGPFYGGYNIVELDSNYQYVMIVGNDRDYLWILSRTPKLDAAVQQRLVEKAKSLGFATDKLIFVKQVMPSK
ncbi:lipocalin family protein [Candidatus Thiothrix anitrata]|uniref:Outer membrane lipoprotein Blc n=1 Tax=Candidatus Thiothrix anitrata TaxID=2823902 RepID=A0ABX7X2Y4_9GAMM|nr:lipocalin family protein [Candidatus Thiothrix anitrata]QTR49138.1 lipocalin family protein [Candidatus Thiothrix anitrata]